MDRRTFLRNLAATTSGLMIPTSMAASPSPAPLAQRRLGRTGEPVTLLGIGGYHIGWTTERDAQEVIETAIDGGIRFFDTAHNYGKGQSETRYGTYLIPRHRDEIFLMTKSQAPDYKTAKAELETSLKRLNTDRVDLWQLHSLQSPEDVDARIQNGILRACEEALSENKARFIGFTGHANPYAHLRMLEQTKGSGLFSTTQLPINVVDAVSPHSFTEKVVPAARQQGLGILAMKTLADGRFFGKKTMIDREIWTDKDPVVPTYVGIEDALRFAWSLPISVLITGAENATMLGEKIQFAKRFTTVEPAHRAALIDRVTARPDRESVEYYKKVKAASGPD